MDIAVAPQKDAPNSPSGSSPASPTLLALIGVGVLTIVAGAIYLLKTNPHSGLWRQGYDPTGLWWLSTLFAAMPVVVLLGTMAVLRLKPTSPPSSDCSPP